MYSAIPSSSRLSRSEPANSLATSCASARREGDGAVRVTVAESGTAAVSAGPDSGTTYGVAVEEEVVLDEERVGRASACAATPSKRIALSILWIERMKANFRQRRSSRN